VVIIGWDVSTAAIGVCVRREGEPDQFSVIFPKGSTHLEKHRSAVKQVEAFLSEAIKPDEKVTHIVEERLGGFTGGFTSKQTLMALAAMNAVVSHFLSHSGTVVHIPPITTKRITGLTLLDGEDKKQAVVRLARSSVPHFPYKETKFGNWAEGVDDMADAWLLTEAGSKVLRGEATLGSSKKAAGSKNKARRAKGNRKTKK